MASITSALESANDLMLRVPTPQLLNRELERSMNKAVDFNNMVLSSYMGDRPVVPIVVTCDCKETAWSQQILDISYLCCSPRHQVVHGRFSIEWLFNGIAKLHGETSTRRN